VSDNQGVPDDPWLSAGVSFGGFGAVGGAARGVDAQGVAEDRCAEGPAREKIRKIFLLRKTCGAKNALVEGYPVFDTVAKGFKANPGVVDKVARALLLVEPSAVPVSSGVSNISAI
jgi:hypothetical protein